MATSEVAVSLAIVKLHDLLSKSKDIITYRKLTDQISDSITNLQGILNTRKHAKVDHDHNQETPEGERLLQWAHEAEQIAEEFLVKLLRHQLPKSQKGRFTKVLNLVRFFSVMIRGSAQKKMAKDFRTEVRKFTSLGPPAGGLPANESASSSSSSKRNRENRQRVETDIMGRDQNVNDLLAWLNVHEDADDSNLRVISVVGEQAYGKTALVRSVFSMLKIKHHFDCQAWIRVTDLGAESDRMKNLLVDILKQTSPPGTVKDLEHKQKKQLFKMLYKLLTGLRYLIVLDNLREPSLINDLLIPFVDSMNGSRVIVTTPNAVVQKFADPWTSNLPLGPICITNEECKKLLRISDDSESEISVLGQRILSKCNGSPPAISLLGGLLSAVEESNWLALMDRLGGRPTLDDVTHLSFDELPHMMKPRVLYMALFPKESEVPTRRLFRQWAAEGLLAEPAADGSVRMRTAEDCFHELESRNFIQVVRRKLDGNARSCRMPAFLHEFFHRKAKESRILQIRCSFDPVSDRESRGMDPEAEWSAQNQQKEAPNAATRQYGYKVQCLQTFASFNTRKLGTRAREIEDLLQQPISDGRPDLLRVLDVEGVYKPVLPEDFGNTLSNLRYLGLRWTVLDSIPESVGNLLLLETLDLKHTNITKVTSAIWNAKNLRHLYLSEASFDESIPNHISSSESKLETLWGLSIKTDKSPMIRVLKKMKNLKKLGVTCCPGAVPEVTKCLPHLESLESLRLRSRDLLGQPAILDLKDTKGPKFHWLQYLSNLYLLGSLGSAQDLPVLPGNLRVLTLSMLELKDDPMEVLQCLKDLIVLRLLGRSCTYRSLCCKAGFPKLRVLKLWMLEELEELQVKKGGMPNLEELEIKQCNKLEKAIGLQHINNLKIVILSGVKEDFANNIGVSGLTLVKKKELIREKESGS